MGPTHKKPGSVGRAHIAHSGSQSERTISFMLPAREFSYNNYAVLTKPAVKMAKYLPSSSFCFIMELDFVSVNENAASLRLLEVNMNVENPPSCFHQVISGSLLIIYPFISFDPPQFTFAILIISRSSSKMLKLPAMN